MMATWNKIRLGIYYHDYIRYLIDARIITEGTAKKIEKRKKGIISNAFERNPAGRNYPFVIVVDGTRLYCLIDVDSGFDLTGKTPEEAAEAISSRKRHRLNYEEVVAVEITHDWELIFLEKSESLATEQLLMAQWLTSASYAETMELT